MYYYFKVVHNKYINILVNLTLFLVGLLLPFLTEI